MEGILSHDVVIPTPVPRLLFFVYPNYQWWTF